VLEVCIRTEKIKQEKVLQENGSFTQTLQLRPKKL